MTIVEEEDIIHKILAKMLANEGSPNYLPDMLTYIGADDNRYVEPILTLLLSDGLADQTNKVNGRFMLLPTKKAVDMARHPNGYKGFVADKARAKRKEKADQDEKSALDQRTALATIEQAKSSACAAKAAWVAAIAAVIGVGLSIFAIVQSSQVIEVKARLDELQKQVLSASKPVSHPRPVDRGERPQRPTFLETK